MAACESHGLIDMLERHVGVALAQVRALEERERVLEERVRVLEAEGAAGRAALAEALRPAAPGNSGGFR